ncbi:hypothetical protein HAX54_010911 [Datura stramonium]|uniref:Secreted protein n=1 Tax=Datura stramonium TaxID=4076 RepID=A0ABS8TJR3_DATST|nr:hypothetical protein [Datura stramonium]
MLGVWGWCLACVSGTFVRMMREWCLPCAYRLDPCLSSDVVTRMPSQSWGRLKLGLLDVGFLCCLPNAQALSSARTLRFDKLSGHGVFISSNLPKRYLSRMMVALILDLVLPFWANQGLCDAGVSEECYLVYLASSHMLVSKIKPCMCKYEQIQTVKLRMAH